MSGDNVLLSIIINKIYVMGTYLIIPYLSHNIPYLSHNIPYLSHNILLSADNMSAFLFDLFCRGTCHYLNLTFIDISPRTYPFL